MRRAIQAEKTSMVQGMEICKNVASLGTLVTLLGWNIEYEVRVARKEARQFRLLRTFS